MNNDERCRPQNSDRSKKEIGTFLGAKEKGHALYFFKITVVNNVSNYISPGTGPSELSVKNALWASGLRASPTRYQVSPFFVEIRFISKMKRNGPITHNLFLEAQNGPQSPRPHYLILSNESSEFFVFSMSQRFHPKSHELLCITMAMAPSVL